MHRLGCGKQRGVSGNFSAQVGWTEQWEERNGQSCGLGMGHGPRSDLVFYSKKHRLHSVDMRSLLRVLSRTIY